MLTVWTVTEDGGNGDGDGARLEETKVDGGGGEGEGSRSGKRVPVSPNEKEERVEMRIGGAAVALARSSALSLRHERRAGQVGVVLETGRRRLLGGNTDHRDSLTSNSTTGGCTWQWA